MADGNNLHAADGRTIRYYDTGDIGDSTLTLVWHHGTPQTGRVLEAVSDPARSRGVRVVSVARPAYEGSTDLPGRSVADASADVLRVVDELGIDRFITAGASGGGPHALGCAALAPDRVSAVLALAGIAPYTSDFDWFAGMADPGGLRAGSQGHDRRAEHAQTAEFNQASFIARDWTALSGDWKSLGADAGAAGASDPEGEIEDDVAFTSPWGFELNDIRVPVLLVHGTADRVVPASHALWQHARIPGSELWERPGDGHISVLAAYPDALDWALSRA
jgi:pimeloyl-ACP methyl ester carboxylesterase